MLSNEEFEAHIRAIRRELQAAEEAWQDVRMTAHGIGRGGTISDVYKALERVQGASFDARDLVGRHMLRSVE
jgi:hypothetical protein